MSTIIGPSWGDARAAASRRTDTNPDAGAMRTRFGVCYAARARRETGRTVLNRRASAGGVSVHCSPRAWGPQLPDGPAARTAAPQTACGAHHNARCDSASEQDQADVARQEVGDARLALGVPRVHGGG